MILLFLVVSLIALAIGLVLPGWSDLVLLAAPVAIASLILLLRRKLFGRSQKWAVLDGSNVMYWRDGTPDLAPVRDALKQVKQHGYKACVIFDANAGYLLFGSYAHDHHFSKVLGLPEKQVMVVPKGTPADPFILEAARDVKAIVVTNDRYRDWTAQYPEVTKTGHLIKGVYRGAQLKLQFPTAHADKKSAT